MGSPIEGISTDENGAKNDVPDALPGGMTLVVVFLSIIY